MRLLGLYRRLSRSIDRKGRSAISLLLQPAASAYVLYWWRRRVRHRFGHVGFVFRFRVRVGILLALSMGGPGAAFQPRRVGCFLTVCQGYGLIGCDHFGQSEFTFRGQGLPCALTSPPHFRQKVVFAVPVEDEPW